MLINVHTLSNPLSKCSARSLWCQNCYRTPEKNIDECLVYRVEKKEKKRNHPHCWAVMCLRAFFSSREFNSFYARPGAKDARWSGVFFRHLAALGTKSVLMHNESEISHFWLPPKHPPIPSPSFCLKISASKSHNLIYFHKDPFLEFAPLHEKAPAMAL